MATCGNKTRLIKVLVQGQKSAKQLLMLLEDNHPPNPKEDDDEGFLAAADGFLQKILTSFSDTIHRINEPNNSSTRPTTTTTRRKKRRSSDDDDNYHPYFVEEDHDSHHKFLCKKRSASTSTSTSLKMDNRGRCYKKRISSSETQTKVSPTMEDGQAWRKYGQKVILNSKFPRSYFRCRHKHDQGCKATKQVQIMKEKPQLLYQTTYIGLHTCRDHITLKAPKLFALSEQQDNMSDLTDNVNVVNSPQPHITLKLEDHHHLHPSNNSVTHHHMYSFGFGAAPFDDVTSTQFDHHDFRIDDLANWLDSV